VLAEWLRRDRNNIVVSLWEVAGEFWTNEPAGRPGAVQKLADGIRWTAQSFARLAKEASQSAGLATEGKSAGAAELAETWSVDGQ
jgi:hypothetical protein